MASIAVAKRAGANMMLCHLWEGEKSVGELVRLTGARDTSISQQLALLRKDGIVVPCREGQTLYYSIAHEGASRVLETLYGVFCEGSGSRS